MYVFSVKLNQFLDTSTDGGGEGEPLGASAAHWPSPQPPGCRWSPGSSAGCRADPWGGGGAMDACRSPTRQRWRQGYPATAFVLHRRRLL